MEFEEYDSSENIEEFEEEFSQLNNLKQENYKLI